MKKIIIAGISILIITALLFMIIEKPFSTFLAGNVSSNAIESLNLTDEEKIQDFDYLYNTICSSMPAVDEYRDIYGFSFRDRKQEYMKMIESSNNDYDFFCTLDAIMEDIPSFHTDLVSPDTVSFLNCYNSTNIKKDPEIKTYSSYWEACINKETKKEAENKYWCFTYVDGTYVYNNSFSTADNDIEFILISINDMSADDYITSHQSIYNLYYDGKNDKPCRTKIIFNENYGDNVNVILEDRSGNRLERSLKVNVVDEMNYYYKMEPITDDELIENFIGDILYLKINSFEDVGDAGSDVKKILAQSDKQKVILDLRDNYGGNMDFAANYIYPYLFSENYDVDNIWYVPETEENKKIKDNPLSGLFLNLKKTSDLPYNQEGSSDFLSAKSSYRYVGLQNVDKKLVCLTSQKTGSAADTFVSFIKDKKLGTLIGNNTGGEGLMGSYIADTLPNSKLAFVYMPGGAKNIDGTDNSVIGTAPDEYATMSVEDFYKKSMLSESGKYLKDIDITLEYDALIRRGVELLSEK